MTRVWAQKMKSLSQGLGEMERRSPVLATLGLEETDDEWRAGIRFDTQTLVLGRHGQVTRTGPVVVGVRYHKDFLSGPPHPQEIATILCPSRVFAPNISSSGHMCLGHPTPGVRLDTILHQIWAGLVFNMSFVNTNPTEVLNPAAAEYVRARADQFPLTRKGLFEPPDQTGGAGAKG